MPMIETRDKTRLYVKDWGKGRPVVLVHGWPLNADSWDDQAKAIAEAGMRAIAYDRRGFGRSDQPWDGYDYDTFADDLADVLKATGATDDIALVGFSMGGGEVARYMSRHEGRGVTRAALIASVVPYLLKTDDNPDGVDKTVFDGITKGIEEDRHKFFHGFFKDFYGVGYVSSPVSDELIDWTRALAYQAGLRPILAAAKAFSTTDFRSDLAAFDVPTLIVHGTADKTVPIDPTARAAAKAIAGAKLVEYDGSAHGLAGSDGPRLARDLIAFLTSETGTARETRSSSAMAFGAA